MTIYQQELLRKLPKLGCEGRMDETDETLYHATSRGRL